MINKINKFILIAFLSSSLILISACSNIFSDKDGDMDAEESAPATNNQQVDEDHHGEEEYANMPSYEIRGRDVLKKVQANENFILIDVREDSELKETGIIESAIQIPLGTISMSTLEEAGVAKDDEVVLYCRSGNRSKQAYDIMTALGYNNVKSMRGGIVHWLEDLRPLVPWTGKVLAKQKANENSSLNAPKISFDREEEDLGLIGLREIKTTEFTVTNEGVSTLEIGNITTSCACTRAEIASKSIKSGESTILTVTFDPTVHEEPKEVFKRTVFLETNDPNMPEAEVTIWVDIDEEETK